LRQGGGIGVAAASLLAVAKILARLPTLRWPGRALPAAEP
jgi:hypothetical protein